MILTADKSYASGIRRMGSALVHDENMLFAGIERIISLVVPEHRERKRLLTCLSAVLQEFYLDIEGALERSKENVFYTDLSPEAYRKQFEQKYKEDFARRMKRLRMMQTSTLRFMCEIDTAPEDFVRLLDHYYHNEHALSDALSCMELLPVAERPTNQIVGTERFYDILVMLRRRRPELKNLEVLSADDSSRLTAALRFLLPRDDSDLTHPKLIELLFDHPDKIDDLKSYLSDYGFSIGQKPDPDHFLIYLNSQSSSLRAGEL